MILQDKIKTEIAALETELINLRRAIHQYPELGLDVPKTAGLVSDALKEEGIPFQKNIGKTGVVAFIDCDQPGPCILLRADMDGLPITEETGLAFSSQVEGRMHACGHDLHTASLVGVAKILWRLRSQLSGSFKLAFQPGEEGLGGAKAMLEDGLLENPRPDCALGFHNWPLLDTGTVGFHPHVSFAGSQNFSITLKGLSGHGAHPHNAIDTIPAAASFITQLQTVVSRRINPVKPAVISIGQIQGGSSPNVIADTVTLSGTMRTIDPDMFSSMRENIERLLNGLHEGMQVSHEVTFSEVLPPLENDPEILKTVCCATRSGIGSSNVKELPESSMGSEDFAYITSQLPSAHLRIGSRIPGTETRMIHRKDFLPDENFISVAVKVLTEAAIALTKKE